MGWLFDSAAVQSSVLDEGRSFRAAITYCSAGYNDAETGRPASRRGQSGQVRKEAATAAQRECRGSGSSPTDSIELT